MVNVRQPGNRDDWAHIPERDDSMGPCGEKLPAVVNGGCAEGSTEFSANKRSNGERF